MKVYIKSSSNDGYLYIFKHGVGPGTIPTDVNVIRSKDLPNYYTAVWLDRFLTADELKQYDIPSETEINRYLGQIGYCQKDGDVVPCDEVEACDKVLAGSYIKSAREPKWWGSTYSCQVIDAYNKGELTYKNMEEWETEYNGGFKPSNMGTKGILDYYIKTGKDPRDEVEACGDIKASKTYHFSRYNGESYTTKPDGTKVLSRKVLRRNVLDMLEDNDKYMNLDFCDAEEITEKATAEELLAIYDEEMTSEEFEALYNRVFGVDACDDIKASSYTIPDKKLIFKDGDSYEFHYTSGEGDVFEPKSGSGNWWTSYIVTPDNRLLSWEFSGRYTPVDAVYGEDFWVEDNSVDACGDVNCATDTRYFANMVNGSSDPELNDDFLVEGYYDEQFRGLAESYETSDISALNEIVNEYANKGYFIRVRNLTDGVICDFSSDNWFDDLAKDGGVELFMYL